MRLTADRLHRTRTPPEVEAIDVFLDGVLQKGALLADDEEGLVVKLVPWAELRVLPPEQVMVVGSRSGKVLRGAVRIVDRGNGLREHYPTQVPREWHEARRLGDLEGGDR